MKLARDPMGTAEGRAILDQLPQLYFAILKNAYIEQQVGAGIRCSFELPIIGKRTKTAPTARDAIRAILVDLAEVLTETPCNEWPKDWHSLALSACSELRASASREGEKSGRFQSKARQFTVGVTMPSTLKLCLQNIADQQDAKFSEVARQLTRVGFEDFDERSFSEGPEDLLSAFSLEIGKWQPSDTEQVMIRLDLHLAVRLRSAAKEYNKSASEFTAMCLAHGFVLQTLMSSVEQKITAIRGSRLRQLAPKLSLEVPIALLSGILAGTVVAPRMILKRLSEFFEIPEFALTAFFKRSFDDSAVPAFKAESGKPHIFRSARSWEEAVKSLKLPPEQTKKLLLLDQ